MEKEKAQKVLDYINSKIPITFEYNGNIARVYNAKYNFEAKDVICNLEVSGVTQPAYLYLTAHQLFERMGWDYSDFL